MVKLTKRLRAGYIGSLALLAVAATGCDILDDNGLGDPEVVEASGATAANIQAAVDAFRSRLGANNGANVATTGGRREINWDGIPNDRLDPFPGDFFNTTSRRGAVFSTPGSRMKVSGDAGTASFEFADVTALLPSGVPWGPVEFSTFSTPRMFATMDSNITDVRFFVPGTTIAAGVKAFGVVLSDVDVAEATVLEFYGAGDAPLLRRTVAPSGVRSEGLSFAGVILPEGMRASRVRIVAGSHPVNAPFQDPPPDGVGIDDVIYSEPVAN